MSKHGRSVEDTAVVCSIQPSCMQVIAEETKEDGSRSYSCRLIERVKGYCISNPEEAQRKLNELGCPDRDSSCSLNRLYL